MVSILRLNNLLFSTFDQPWPLHLLMFAMENFLDLGQEQH